MKDFVFSADFMEQLEMLKTSDFREELFSNIRRLKEYMREEEYAEISSAIEKIVEVKPTGNIITSHTYGTYSEWLWKDHSAFIQTMIEDLFEWFMFESTPLECRLFCIGLHIDEYEFTDNDLEHITFGIMENFIAKGIPCPDVVLIPTLDYKRKMENGYFILGLK